MIVSWGEGKDLMQAAWVEELSLMIVRDVASGRFVITNSPGVALHFGASHAHGGIPVFQCQQAKDNPTPLAEAFSAFPELGAITEAKTIS